MTDYQNLGNLLAEADRTAAVAAVVQLGIKLDPYDARPYKVLTLLEIAAQH